MLALLTCILLTAAFTSLIVESPIGSALRVLFAGDPTRSDWATHRALQSRSELTLGPPQPRHPWLSEALSCPLCVSAHISWMVTIPYRVLDGGGPLQWWLLWPATWMGARLLLGAARAVESVSGD